MKGRVEADAKYFRLPYDVLVGRDSGIIKTFRITKLPHLYILGSGGRILFSEKYASYEDLLEEVEKALRTGP